MWRHLVSPSEGHAEQAFWWLAMSHSQLTVQADRGPPQGNKRPCQWSRMEKKSLCFFISYECPFGFLNDDVGVTKKHLLPLLSEQGRSPFGNPHNTGLEINAQKRTDFLHIQSTWLLFDMRPVPKIDPSRCRVHLAWEHIKYNLHCLCGATIAFDNC